MRYIGEISGNGTLKCEGVDIASASYDFESYSRKTGGLTGSGEITLAPEALKSCFGRSGVQLMTEDGRMFNLTFPEKLMREPNVAHVVVSGDLPAERNWRH
ncbi:hypothetical protein [Oricola nitratireducens]|uniref:hypothetical protein n=1 Tax=Oricola nitratireducens TaxID=2775868 RepID=UPI001866A4A0|nr:hypothetical protein [Oricola nitratireducens]